MWRKIAVPAVLFAVGPGIAANAVAAPPVTVPAVRSWTDAPGTFRLAPGARVVVRPSERHTDAEREARVLAEDLGRQLGRDVAVTAARGARARDGDVVLSTATHDGDLGAEGYALRVGRAFTITAPTAAGAFYGGRTLLQLLRGGAPIPQGSGRDLPRYGERGLMVDVARRFYNADWVTARIRELADLKLNLLHLHLADDQGFRMPSVSHPEAVSGQHYTPADIARILEVARRNHVVVVPEIDMPGHMTAALRAHPELQLADALGQRQPDKLDVTLPPARRFAAELVADGLALFDGPFWHQGNDEYLGVASTPLDAERYPQLRSEAQRLYGPGAVPQDAVLAFANGIAKQVRAAGRQPRAWSDGLEGGVKAALDPAVVIEWWEELHSPPPARLIADGHTVLNAGWWPLYYVTGGPLTGLRTSEKQMFENWRPSEFTGPYTLRWGAGPRLAGPAATVPVASPGLRGATLNVWNDDPTAEAGAPAAVAAGIRPRLRILAQRTWGSAALSGDYEAWAQATARAAAPAAAR